MRIDSTPVGRESKLSNEFVDRSMMSDKIKIIEDCKIILFNLIDSKIKKAIDAKEVNSTIVKTLKEKSSELKYFSDN
jgi:hypothetical protein